MTWPWLSAPDYWLARLVVQRLLAVVYLLGFLAAARQGRALLGAHGITPIPRFLAMTPFRRAPSVFQWHYSDRFLAVVSWSGVVLAAAAVLGVPDLLGTPAGMVHWAVLWALYLSIVNVGQIWYSFGWESLLLEAGFLAIFLGQGGTAPPVLVLWLLRWVVFRLEFGAGLIKIRGDRCWRTLTCLYYHHETQPLPNPLSWFFHKLPRPLHRVEVLANHVAQLVVPFGLFAPQPVAGAAALIIILTQSWLLLSGNFAWLNLLTITLAAGTLDDRFLRWLPVTEPRLTALPGWHQVLEIALAVLVAVLSFRPAANLLASTQVMNRSFDHYHLVNTYGAFGSVTRHRDEVVVEGTVDAHPGPGTEWREYGFRGKPGDPLRLPPQVAPYHLRLDWLLWFVGISPGYSRGWFTPFLDSLLRGDRDTLNLLRRNPFPDEPPRWIRAELYRYRYTTVAERRHTGAWWHREPLAELVPPRSLPGRRVARTRREDQRP